MNHFLIILELMIMGIVGGVVGYATYSVMKEKVEKLEKEKCPYGRSCEIYNKKNSKETLDRVVNLLIRRVDGCNRGLCDECIKGCDKSEAIKILNDIRKV
jgi:hypothetical protein